MKVSETYLSKVRIGDVIMFVKGNIYDWLGAAIVLGSGNLGYDENEDGEIDEGFGSGNYTHCGFVSKLPDPNAEVKEVRPGVYEVIDSKRAGKMVHATWPVIKEEPINWTNETSEFWRIRKFAHEYEKRGRSIGAERAVAWCIKRKGRPYNLLQLLTFGWLRLSFSWICSGLLYRSTKSATIHYDEPIFLSPEGDCDKLPTPNDVINSKKMFRIIGWLSHGKKK